MELTELQKLLIEGLKFFDLEKENGIMVMLMLKSSEQAQWDMLFWVRDNIYNNPTQEQVMDKAEELMDLYSIPKKHDDWLKKYN